MEIFSNADIFLFCSAAVSRRVMEADPMNTVHCPYCILVADAGNGLIMGHRAYPDGPMQEVEALLDFIIIEARAQWRRAICAGPPDILMPLRA